MINDLSTELRRLRALRQSCTDSPPNQPILPNQEVRMPLRKWTLLLGEFQKGRCRFPVALHYQ